jgi:hypothetical protein
MHMGGKAEASQASLKGVSFLVAVEATLAAAGAPIVYVVAMSIVVDVRAATDAAKEPRQAVGLAVIVQVDRRVGRRSVMDGEVAVTVLAGGGGFRGRGSGEKNGAGGDERETFRQKRSEHGGDSGGWALAGDCCRVGF